VFRAETPIGFVVERVRQEDAMGNLDTLSQSDTLGRLAAVRATGKFPFRGAQRMVVTLGGGDPGTSIPTDDSQSTGADGRIVIESPDPPDNAAQSQIPESIQTEYLRSDPFVQANSSRIREQAQAIVSGAEGDWTKAMRLYEWVYESIEKAPVLSVPSALDVLEKRRGDCNENTILYTALARAEGIPTRIAIGIVWSEEYEAFYYHAWPEVYMGRWIWLDPTLGQPIADATHIKLLTGGIENWWQLVPHLGKLHVQVDEIE
jgi:transglutaminase-like putative cysteine protease